MPNKRQAQAGFAIVEVLVATVVLAIGFIELSRAFRNINSVANQAVAMTKASNLVHATMERIMAQNFDARGNDLEFGDYALDFDGTDDYVDTGSSFQTTFRSSFTISCWIMANDGQPENKQCVLGTQNSSDQDCVRLEIDDDGTIEFHYEADGNDATAKTSSAIFSNGATDWTHIVCVADDSQDRLYIYVNGESQTVAGNNVSGVTFSSRTSADELFIGALDLRGSADRYFAGKIDEVRIWNDVRTAAEIKANYNRSLSDPYEETNLKLYLRMNNDPGAVAFDHSSNMAHGTINGATYTSGSISWTSNSNLGAEGEANWSENNDVDDFEKTATDSLLDDDFSGLGGRIYVKYVSINTDDPRDGTIANPYTFDDSVSPTNYKQITVKVGIPGTTDSTQLDAIKAAKVNQGYRLDFSPYGN